MVSAAVLDAVAAAFSSDVAARYDEAMTLFFAAEDAANTGTIGTGLSASAASTTPAARALPVDQEDEEDDHQKRRTRHHRGGELPWNRGADRSHRR